MTIAEDENVIYDFGDDYDETVSVVKPDSASGTQKDKKSPLHPLRRVKELTNYTREWLADNMVCVP